MMSSCNAVSSSANMGKGWHIYLPSRNTKLTYDFIDCIYIPVLRTLVHEINLVADTHRPE